MSIDTMTAVVINGVTDLLRTAPGIVAVWFSAGVFGWCVYLTVKEAYRTWWK